eukprot:CAMPEP_0206257518 /NCGR_PEP_ID=MMETSP0047_2-20121206/25384_1 /ASSEMBLY_ACC=CAM_ASM_000192 /TAXON_ID=195065 /ORGANISM="Chroomonas mesostigmatica_cf, Strain CCMP1168" /LENGTH=466 /DNA_ID=CAMNT_0053684111 /DNA_START=185 /DNA_END=1585 /DNA_ORIENTATION=+
MPQLLKHLDEWRGLPPDPKAFQDKLKRIDCAVCIDQGLKNGGFFDRDEMEQLLEEDRQRKHDETEHHSKKGPSGVATARCQQGHDVPIQEMLSKSTIFEAIKCPQCVRAKEVPPFCFNRRDCLLYFAGAEGDARRQGTVECQRCAVANRPSSIRIIDVVSPEVYISYHWGVQDPKTKLYSTQAKAKALRSEIEQGADLLCYLDLEGASGPNHSYETKEAIRRCTVMVMLLSDTYINTAACKRDYSNAARFGKYIIPVLLPKAKNAHGGHNPGWGGATHGKTWWLHAERNTHKLEDPATGEPFSWSALAQFEPVPMVDGGEHDSVPEIVSRISSRFHRGEHIDHKTRQLYTEWRKRRELASLLDDFRSVRLRPGTDTTTLRLKAKLLFDKIDSDQSGTIDSEELFKTFEARGVVLEQKEVNKLIQDADVDGDKMVDFNEFFRLVVNIVQAQDSLGLNEEEEEDGEHL